jgi:N-acetylmuramoyl-L-alanine amidase
MRRASRESQVSRTSKILMGILMLACAIVLVLAASGLLALPDGNPSDTSKPNGSTAETTTGPTSPSTGPTTAENLIPLPTDSHEPEPTPPTGLRRWPAESSLPLIHEVDLSSYKGRPASGQPLAGITVILDPGHGGQDGGTVYPEKSPLIIEKDITLAVGLTLRDQLEAMGATVVMMRETDEWLSVYCRIAMVGRYTVSRFIEELPYHGYDSSVVDGLLPQLDEMISINSDAESSGGRGLLQGAGVTVDARRLLDIQAQYADTLFISLHCNSLSSDTRVSGIQTYYLTTEHNYQEESSSYMSVNSKDNPPVYTLFADDKRLTLATGIRDSVLALLPDMKFKGNTGLVNNSYAVLREMNLVNVLVEMGFVTNENDRQLLMDPNGRQKIAQGIAEAVYNYYCTDG